MKKYCCRHCGRTLFEGHFIGIPRLTLPALATGTVVPAGFGEFTAILGDNKREPEIVSPESYMKQAFLDALTESGITAGGGTQIIKLVVDGRTLTEIVNRENQRSGRAVR